jgi:WD40 repeat protein
VARLGTDRFRHDLALTTAVCTPDGKVVIAGGMGPYIHAWETASGKVLPRFGWNIGPVWKCALAPNGKLLAAVGNDGAIRLYDLGEQKEVRRFAALRSAVPALAFAQDGETLASWSDDGAVRVWTVATGKQLQKLTWKAWTPALALPADGKTLIAADMNGTVACFDLGSGRETRRFPAEGLRFVLGLSPDGKRLAGQGPNRTIQIWDVESGKAQGTCKGDSPPDLSALAFSADGKLLVGGGGTIGQIRLWDADTGEPVRLMKGVGKSRIHSIGLFPDGKALWAGAVDQSLRRWNAVTGELLGQMEGHGNFLNAVAVSPDGKILASGDADGTIRLWDWETRRERRQLLGHQKSVTCLLFSSDGKALVSGSDDETVRVWDLARGEAKQIIVGHKRPFYSIALSRDGEILAAAGPAPRLWQVETGEERARLGKTIAVDAVAFTPDGQSLVTASGIEKAIRVFSTDSGKEQRVIPAGPCRTLALSADGKQLALGTFQGTVHVLDFATGKELWQQHAHPQMVSVVTFARDGKQLVSAGGGSVRVWNAATGKDLTPLPGHQGWVFAAAFRDKGRTLFTVGQDRTLRQWDISTGNETRKLETLPGVPGTILCAAFSPDGAFLAMPSGQASPSLHVCEVATGREVRVLRGPQQFSGVAVSQDGKLVAGTIAGQSTVVWEMAKGAEVCKVPDGTVQLTFVPNADVLVLPTRDRLGLRYWSTTANKQLLTFKGAPGSIINCLACSPDGRMLALGGHEGQVSIWEVATGKERLRFMGPSGAVSAVAFSPSAFVLATGSDDRSVQLWDLTPSDPKAAGEPPARVSGLPPAGRELARFDGHRSSISVLVFSPDGRRLISGSHDSTFLVWDLRRVSPGASLATKISKADLHGLWEELAADNAARAYRALRLLAANATDAVPLLREQLLMKAAIDPKQIAELLKELSDDKPEVSAKAADELWKLGRQIEPALQAALRDSTSAESRLRVQRLLDRLGEWVPPPKQLRALRAIEALERMETSEAKKLLEQIAQGKDQVSAQAAKASLERLAK